MTEQEEQIYLQGQRAAWVWMLRTALRELVGSEAYTEIQLAARLALEREDTISALREGCREFGDNDWEESLHLRDIVEKHLLDNLRNPDTPLALPHTPFVFRAPPWVNTVAAADAVEALQRAESLASTYYAGGAQTGIHSMIEWCGVMGEYVKMLKYAHENGHDPREVDQHHDVAVEVPDFMIGYLCEKLGCQLIPFIRANPDEWRKKIDAWFEKEAGS